MAIEFHGRGVLYILGLGADNDSKHGALAETGGWEAREARFGRKNLRVAKIAKLPVEVRSEDVAPEAF